MRTEPETLEEFHTLWQRECEEWNSVRKSLTRGRDNGHGDRMPRVVTAERVTREWRRRIRARGEVSVLDSLFARRFITRALDKIKLEHVLGGSTR